MEDTLKGSITQSKAHNIPVIDPKKWRSSSYPIKNSKELYSWSLAKLKRIQIDHMSKTIKEPHRDSGDEEYNGWVF